MNECPYCQNTFERTETCADEFRMWQGLQGPYYIPAVDSIGNLSWTNTGELQNPDPVNIAGKGLTIVGIVEDVSDLPESANDFDAYLVGETDNYQAYIWDGAAWVDIGLIRGPQGPAGPQVDPATAAPLMDGTAAVGTSTKYAREDHVHPQDAELKTSIIQSDKKTIDSGGTKNYTLTGITADHVVGNWGMFTDSDCIYPIPENAPTCDIEVTTANGTWTAVISNFSSTFYWKPTFIKD